MAFDEIEPKRISLYNMRLTSGKPGSAITRICGTTYRSLRNWEIGSSIPNIVNVQDLLQIYGYSFYELDLASFYPSEQVRIERQCKIDAVNRIKTPLSNPPVTLTLYDMRQKSGLSGAVVANICDTTYRSLRNWETGASIPTVINVNDLLQVYGYSFYELDLKPFYKAFRERSKKQKELDERVDNPLRDRKQFEEKASLQTETVAEPLKQPRQ